MKVLIVLGVVALALAGCATQRGNNALAGGAVGAATGALIGGLATGRTSGALIGAAIGGATGAAVGASATPACQAVDRRGRPLVDQFGRPVLVEC
jgi:hypothetical protein